MWAFLTGFFVGDTLRKSNETDAERQARLARGRGGWAIAGYGALLFFGLCLLVVAVVSAF